MTDQHNPATLRALLERVGAAEGPDRGLDAEIEAALFGGIASHLCMDRARRSYGLGFVHDNDEIGRHIRGGRRAPDYTSILDTALALTKRVPPDWHWTIASTNTQFEDKPWADLASKGWIADRPGTEHEQAESHGATPALALLAALIAALIAEADAREAAHAD